MVMFMDDWYVYLTGTYCAVMVRNFVAWGLGLVLDTALLCAASGSASHHEQHSRHCRLCSFSSGTRSGTKSMHVSDFQGFTERRCNVLPVWALASMRPEVVIIPDSSVDGRRVHFSD